MAKILSEKQVFNRLKKFYEATFTQAEQAQAEFYTDREGDLEWTWRFDIGNVEHHLTIDRCDGEINHEQFKHITSFR